MILIMFWVLTWWPGFVIFRKTKAFIFLGVLPLFCFLSSCTAKNLTFFLYSWAFYNLRYILGLYLDHWITFFLFLYFSQPKSLNFFGCFAFISFFFNASWGISMDYIFIFVQSLWVRHFQLWFSNIWHDLLSHICHPLFIWSDDWIW